MMIFGKKIKGRKIKFINLIPKCLNGKAKRLIRTATYKHATFHVIVVHSAIPKKTEFTRFKKTQYQTNLN